MNDFRPLREVFDGLVAAGDGPVAAGLPDDLPDELLAEALVGYSDTAPVEVAEHLEEFTTAVTSDQVPDPGFGLGLLGTAPTPDLAADPVDAVGMPSDPIADAVTDCADALDAGHAGTDGSDAVHDDIDFGTGTTEIRLPDPSDHADAPDEELEAPPEPAEDLTFPADAPPEPTDDWWQSALVHPDDEPAADDTDTPDLDDA